MLFLCIKAVSDTVFVMIKAVYYDKPQNSEYLLLNTFKFVKAVSDTVLDMINSAYYE